MNSRAIERILRAETAKFAGVTFELATRRKHRIIVLRRGEYSRMVVTSLTPSDGRAVKNIVGDIRRTIKSMGV